METELELQYSPSRWVTRIPIDEVVTEHVRVVTQASEAARKIVPYVLDLRYGERDGQRYDLYGKDLPIDSPLFVYIHGGYWQLLSREISAYPVIPLWQAGVRCVVVDYDLAPNVTIDVIIQEIRELAVFILEVAKKDKCKCVWFGGHSAGAHLAASLLEADWFNDLDPDLKELTRGVILISGVFDLTPLIHTSENNNLQLTREKAIKGSPMFKTGALNAVGEMKALLAVAEDDSPAFHGQTVAYSKVLKKKNVQTKLIEIQGADHFSIVENLQCPSNVLTEAIIKLIKEHDP